MKHEVTSLCFSQAKQPEGEMEQYAGLPAACCCSVEAFIIGDYKFPLNSWSTHFLRLVEALLAIRQPDLFTLRRKRGNNYISDPDSQEVFPLATSVLCVRTSL